MTSQPFDRVIFTTIEAQVDRCIFATIKPKILHSHLEVLWIPVITGDEPGSSSTHTADFANLPMNRFKVVG